jgi:hypothetical protein
MRMIFGAIGGMKIGRGNRSTQRKPAPAPLCPPQYPTTDPVSNPDRSGGKPTTNHLSYCVAFFSPILSPLTICRVTVKVFDSASTRGSFLYIVCEIICIWWIENNVKEISCGIFEVTIPAWKEWGKPRQPYISQSSGQNLNLKPIS